jgi:hypothetical protein
MKNQKISQELGFISQIEPETTSLEDLPLEKQLKLLTALKDMKDCEKGKAKKAGFGNSLNPNHKRDSKVYTTAENNFKAIADRFGLNYLHEWQIKAKDSELGLHCYKIDFYFPDFKIAVEINPEFHYSYKPVFIRDKIRKIALKKFGIKTYAIKSDAKNRILTNRAKFVLNLIEDAGISHETLKYWLSGLDFANEGTGIAYGVNEDQNELEFDFQPIKGGIYANQTDNQTHFGFGLEDGLYSRKGVYYLPNFKNAGKNAVESYKYRLESSDFANGAFKTLIQSLAHETVHKALFDIIGTKSVAFDEIDKTADGNYIISSY